MELAGIFYHVGENDTAFYPYRKNPAKWLNSTVSKNREEVREFSNDGRRRQTSEPPISVP